ncbi:MULTISPECIES: FMN-dependent NADH-azoreductase [Pseudomonas]|uniref:FMN dependent NADH:quinone oxidoreductase n=1 Tax=Pseudomonas syringae pv. aptata TaxID=83167 RepID=A0A0Q0IPT2_PSEAP|nr:MULTISPECIES: FMN-dependent NADH-azoreductase [Pseudomonas]KPZ03381.1 FMN-dependent NADH-azoreductase [Pseudomonas syringae pv. aptata]MBP1121793.1 FMN-dependent NADH-azoreductase [Pseudomonas sp. PvP028]MDP5168366.1 FMN-dependent NADH-azoreductase [Pseudomonas syringae pv. aptata str. DSM 50252]RMO45706.1 FMN-dependent proteinH-azoreductase [Pseudomonas syringae]RMO56534.1 FMN-dependent proteinH-azoreductase [Pseudomonas syringae pv. aptata]
MNLLHLDSSILGDHSASRQLTREVVQAYLNVHADSQVTYRDLASDALGHFSAASLAAAGTPVDVRDAAQQQEVAGNEATLQQFLDSDVLVIGAPMYNFTIPTQLKAWFDRILIAGRTFRYSEAGPEGLCGGKKVIIVSTSGGLHAGQPTGTGHEELLKTLFAFIGITDLQFVRAHGLAYGEEPRASAMSAAQQYIQNELFAA